MHIARCNLLDPAVLRRVHAIQRAAYSVEAELIGTRAIPPLHETVEQLAAAGEREEFHGAFEDAASEDAAGLERNAGREEERCIGFVALEAEESGRPGSMRISRLAVDPVHFRRGVGRRLIAHALDLHARGAGPRSAGGRSGVPGDVIVSTGAANGPGRRLYESFGFVLAREFGADGVEIVEYRKRG